MATRQVIALKRSSQVPASQTDLEVVSLRVPRYHTLRSVYVWCRALAGTVSVDIWKNGATVLTADVTPTAGAHVAGAIDGALDNFALGDELQVTVTTAAASTLDDLVVTVDLG